MASIITKYIAACRLKALRHQRCQELSMTTKRCILPRVAKNGHVEDQLSENISTTSNPQASTTTKKPKTKLNFQNLNQNVQQIKDSKIDGPIKIKKSRTKVDLEAMKEELKQLEDPPKTPEEKAISANRLQYEFYDTPCEELAQNLLGKILVRQLENGTILRGRIVETESYLGGTDKASQTYQFKVTPRNLPMYMPPGTIYVYLTYGMYCCFNISSRGKSSGVLIASVEPLKNSSEYMELLMNAEKKPNEKETRMANAVNPIESHQLCNHPLKICRAFSIEKEHFDGKSLLTSDSLWIENDSNKLEISVVAAPFVGRAIHRRFFVLGNPCVRDGAAVLLRGLEPIQGLEEMLSHRTCKLKSKNSKSLKPHELCSGPSKLCIALQIDRDHRKYSLCTWKRMWIENDSNPPDNSIKIVKCSRIGIESAGPEWANKPLRYYIYGNTSVSKRDKKAETMITSPG